MNEFELLCRELLSLVEEWESKLAALAADIISERRNSQNRNIKQIVGHMVDSASNNTHRIIHLQYQSSPCNFPDYANLGVNDKWIAIQNYEDEEWHDLIRIWKYTNIHIVHVIRNINTEKLDNIWISAVGKKITLREMVTDYPQHFKLHLDEITELMM